MRIERIKCSSLTGLGDVDWTFPVGPVLLFFEDRSHQRMLGHLLLELFYDQKKLCNLKAKGSRGLVQVWITAKNTRYHVRRDFIERGSEFVWSSTLVRDEGTGENVSLPENITLGEYLFEVNLQSFRQGVLVNWPEKNEREYLKLRVNNLRHGGDEEISLIKIRTSLAGAQNRVSEQKGNMVLVKAEYDALRREWDEAYRHQDEERLLLIEIKNLQENEAILSESIASALIMQERLALLIQNPDYRELRQLQGEITQLEERILAVDSSLLLLTSESKIDWSVIEKLREECLEWAYRQEKVENITVKVKIWAEEISALKGSIQTSGYEGLPNDEAQHLRRAEEERAAAQVEINKLSILEDDLESTQLLYSKEKARLEDYADMTDVTEADEVKITKRENHLRVWQNSRISNALDRTLRKHFSGTSIENTLASRLSQYYEGYRTSNFEEFTVRLNNFRGQQKVVERLVIRLEQLRKKAQEQFEREDILRRVVQTRTELISHAFHVAKVADFTTWLKGWENYQRNKQLLALKVDQLQQLREQSQREEIKLQACAEQLREKLGDWDTPVTNRDEVVAAVFKVASQLRAKGEAEREIIAYSQKFKDLLGQRNIERIAIKLEPIADLEREARVSDQERQAELDVWQKDRQEIRKKRAKAEQSLMARRKLPSLTDLEKKIETVKRQWIAYEDLHSAIDDAHVWLEASWQEWQAKFGKVLNKEMKWILSKFSSQFQGSVQTELSEVKQEYFAYRMAIAQLSLGGYSEVPLFFSVGAIDEGERFWVAVIEYFRKLSHTRQMILITTDPDLREKLTGVEWSILYCQNE